MKVMCGGCLSRLQPVCEHPRWVWCSGCGSFRLWPLPLSRMAVFMMLCRETQKDMRLLIYSQALQMVEGLNRLEGRS